MIKQYRRVIGIALPPIFVGNRTNVYYVVPKVSQCYSSLGASEFPRGRIADAVPLHGSGVRIGRMHYEARSSRPCHWPSKCVPPCELELLVESTRHGSSLVLDDLAVVDGVLGDSVVLLLENPRDKMVSFRNLVDDLVNDIRKLHSVRSPRCR